MVRKIIAYLLHVLLPRTCHACGCDLPWNYNQPLCKNCMKQLQVPGPLICRRCGAVLKSGGAHCFACRGSKAKKYKCQTIRSAWVFNTPSRALVHALKYNQQEYVAPFMAEQMMKRFCAYPELSEADLIIPVPLFPRRKRARGYNQSELLARYFSKQTGIDLDVASLVRVRNTVSQTTLGRRGRLENMVGAFLCKNPSNIKGKTVLLIDDVATTGATLEGCAVALKQSGAKKVLAYTYARE